MFEKTNSRCIRIQKSHIRTYKKMFLAYLAQTPSNSKCVLYPDNETICAHLATKILFYLWDHICVQGVDLTECPDETRLWNFSFVTIPHPRWSYRGTVKQTERWKGCTLSIGFIVDAEGMTEWETWDFFFSCKPCAAPTEVRETA